MENMFGLRAEANFSFPGSANVPMGRNDGRPRAARHERGCQRENPSRRGLVQSETAGQRAFWKYSLIDLLWEDTILLHEGQTAGARTGTCTRTHKHSRMQGYLGGINTNPIRQVRAVRRMRWQKLPANHTCAHVHVYARERVPDQTCLLSQRTYFHLPSKTPRWNVYCN